MRLQSNPFSTHTTLRIKKIWLGLLVFALWLSACAKKQTTPKVGFYYWKTQFNLGQPEITALDSLHAQSLYVRIFDVDWDFNRHQAIPKGAQTNHPVFPQAIQPVPTIYITNRTLTHTKSIDSLAQKIIDYTQDILKKWPTPPTKLQLDNDWTPSTKAKYFQLIRYIKSKANFETLSTTIRLHQYKYPKQTGIPPADEGILMCYNTGDITDWNTQNSIATPKDVQKYIQHAKAYPLDLGVALPIFSWTVIFRDSSFFKIVTDDNLSWQQDTIHYRRLSPTRFVVQAGTFLKGHYLYKGDLLRYESVKQADLLSMAQSLSEKQAFSEILFYHLDSANLKKNNYPMLRQVIQTLR